MVLLLKHFHPHKNKLALLRGEAQFALSLLKEEYVKKNIPYGHIYNHGIL